MKTTKAQKSWPKRSRRKCASASSKLRKPGALKGKLRVGKAFFAPLTDDELRGWK